MRSVLDDLRGTPPAAIVIVTDGINTDGPSLADAAVFARRKGVPLFVVGLGSDQPLRDLELSDLLVDEVVFVDDMVNFQFQADRRAAARATAFPSCSARRASRRCWPQVEATVGADGQPQEVRLPYRPKEVGQFPLRHPGRAAATARCTKDSNRLDADDPGAQGEDSRAAGAGVSEFRVPLSAQHAGPRRDDRAAHRPAGCRHGVLRAGSNGAAQCFRSAATNCSPTT